MQAVIECLYSRLAHSPANPKRSIPQPSLPGFQGAGLTLSPPSSDGISEMSPSSPLTLVSMVVINLERLSRVIEKTCSP
jgi:hypothetical protein